MNVQEDDKRLLEFARQTIRTFLEKKQTLKPPKGGPQSWNEKSGIFCTIHKDGELRGCIGYPEPIFPLIEALIRSAISAATQDPRFEPMTLDEFNGKNIELELTILTPPVLVKVDSPEKYLEYIEIGRHGLIAELGGHRGLLLPQVPVEWGWNVKEFLEHTCNKAWLPPNAWKDRQFKLYSFEGRIIKEE